MHRPRTPPDNKCPMARADCNLQCKYNRFAADELEIHAWELKCLDCGYRQTIAYRSDDEDIEDVDWASGQQETCPFCQRSELSPGINPCGE